MPYAIVRVFTVDDFSADFAIDRFDQYSAVQMG